MKLRKSCEHDLYDPHWTDQPSAERGMRGWCPGGVFLPDDVLVVDKELLEATIWRLRMAGYVSMSENLQPVVRFFDALSVREAE